MKCATVRLSIVSRGFRCLSACLAGAVFVAVASRVAALEPVSSPAILEEFRSFDEMGSVLFVAAHPDDENTQLIAYLAGGRHYRTAYLSLTRGDGGQNVLGPEFGEELGVIRTQELLAARRIDGGRQFFSRAIDFGFSKDYRETLRIWDRQQVLSDIVRVIRLFRPDVVITRFSPEPGNTHGHHTASTVLALEAFRMAGDPKSFPEQLKGLAPWQPKRIVWNVGGFQRGEGADTNLIRIDIDGSDPVTGESFGEIAARSRSMHKTQGFGNFRGYGGGGARTESFRLLDGDPATGDILDGVDTTWGRVSGGAEIGRLAGQVVSQFNPQDPAASVPALLEMRARLAGIPADPLVDEKRIQLDRILQDCLGLSVDTLISNAEAVPGETLKLRTTAVVRSSVPVRWMGIRYPSIGREIRDELDLQPGKEATRDTMEPLPAETPLTQPYWLREEPSTGMFRVEDPSLIGQPENRVAFPVDCVFEVAGQTLVVPGEPEQVPTDSAAGGLRRRLEVIAPISLKFSSDVRLFAPQSSRQVGVEVAAWRDGVAGTVQLDVPAGWRVKPVHRSFLFKSAGERKIFEFAVTAPHQPGEAVIAAGAEVNGTTCNTERIEIHYSHIPPLLLQPKARLKAVCLNLSIRGRRVGYVAGAGDSVAGSLQEMGYSVQSLGGTDFTPERLRGLDAVVIGIRAFNLRKDLIRQLPALFAYAEAGGNVIVQYNNPNGLQTNQLAPFELRLSQQRVTDETAPVTFLAPDHPALNTPNKITSADFDGWVQERGLYFPDRWDDRFVPLIACSDPGEAPLRGGLLVARCGKGYFVYTGLAWFRQLPAGVPGAYRLFANLVSLGR